jgi:hypothetical protein
MTNDEAITSVVRDYFEGWFDADAARMERALHHNLVKRSSKVERILTKDAMVEMTRNGDGREDGRDRSLDIRVGDVYGDIAHATVHSSVYHEYVQLVRTDDGWKIVTALWQAA